MRVETQSEAYDAASMYLHPNPASTFLKFYPRFGGECKLRLLDVFGRAVYEEDVSLQHMQPSNLSPPDPRVFTHHLTPYFSTIVSPKLHELLRRDAQQRISTLPNSHTHLIIKPGGRAARARFQNSVQIYEIKSLKSILFR